MKANLPGRVAVAMVIALSLVAFSGCFKRTSSSVVTDDNFWAVTQKISVTNPVGAVTANGDSVRLFNPSVHAEKRVQTFSLLGLANPEKYLNAVEVFSGVNGGELVVGVSVQQLSFLERLFVKVTPQVTLRLDMPVALPTDVEVNVGNVELNNLVGTVNAKTNVGEINVASSLGIFGSQSFDINIGSLTIRLPGNAPVRYDLETSIGKINTSGFNAEVERRLLGARTTGVTESLLNPPFLKGQVNIGNIGFYGE